MTPKPHRKKILVGEMYKSDCFDCYFHTCDPDFGVEGCRIYYRHRYSKYLRQYGCNKFKKAGFWRKILQKFGN